MTAGIATEKQVAIAAELRENPARADAELARALGVSRALVRRMRARLGLQNVEREVPASRPARASVTSDEPAPPAPGREGRPWPKHLDPVFEPAGFADILESELRALLEWEGRLSKFLGRLEQTDRARFAARDRMRLHHEILALARRIQLCYVPAGPCPFCGVEHKSMGCHRCEGGGWAPAELVDVFSSAEEKSSRRRWWRTPKVEVPG